MKKCFLCPNQTEGALCTTCAEDVVFLGATPPDPNATVEELKEWAKKEKVQVFSCKMPP